LANHRYLLKLVWFNKLYQCFDNAKDGHVNDGDKLTMDEFTHSLRKMQMDISYEDAKTEFEEMYTFQPNDRTILFQDFQDWYLQRACKSFIKKDT
jgi:hypothetical protein